MAVATSPAGLPLRLEEYADPGRAEKADPVEIEGDQVHPAANLGRHRLPELTRRLRIEATPHRQLDAVIRGRSLDVDVHG